MNKLVKRYSLITAGYMAALGIIIPIIPAPVFAQTPPPNTAIVGVSGKVVSVDLATNTITTQVVLVYATGGYGGILLLLPPGKIFPLTVLPTTQIIAFAGNPMTLADVKIGALFNATATIDLATLKMTASKIQFTQFSADQPILVFTGYPTVVPAGQQTTLSWFSLLAQSCWASDGWSNKKPLSGSEKLTPTQATVYTLTCTGSTGLEVKKSVAVTVVGTVPSPTPTPTYSQSSYYSQSTYTTPSPTPTTTPTTSPSHTPTPTPTPTPTYSQSSYYSQSTYATPSPTPAPTPPAPGPLQIGDRVRVTTNTNLRSCGGLSCGVIVVKSAGAEGVLIGGPVNVDGYVWWQVNFDTDPDGWMIQDSLQRIGRSDLGPGLTFILTPNLEWTTVSADSCLASGAWSGSKPTQGSEPLPRITVTSSFTLTCMNTQGSTAKTITITIP